MTQQPGVTSITTTIGARTPQEQFRDARLRTRAYQASLWLPEPLVLLIVAAAAWHWFIPTLIVLAVLGALEQARHIVRHRTGRNPKTPLDGVRQLLLAADWSRKWTTALVDAGAANPPVSRSFEKFRPGGARLHWRSIRATPAGVRFTTKGRVDAILQNQERIAIELNRPVTVNPNPLRPAEALVTVRLRNPLASMTGKQWPCLTTPVDGWEPCPIAMDEDADAIKFDMVQGSMFAGGLRGKGKSGLLHLLCAYAVKAPNMRLWIMDGKGSELLPFWGPLAVRQAGYDAQEAIALLEDLTDVMEERAQSLGNLPDGPARRIPNDPAFPIHLLVIDEIAEYAERDDDEEAKKILKLLGRIVRLGRSAGITPVVATQRPSHDLIPTKIRDQFAYKVAFGCANPESSDIVLGRGKAARGWDASTLEAPGHGIFQIGDSEGMRHGMTFYLTDEQIASIVTEQQLAPDMAALEQLLKDAPPPSPDEPTEWEQAPVCGTCEGRGYVFPLADEGMQPVFCPDCVPQPRPSTRKVVREVPDEPTEWETQCPPPSPSPSSSPSSSRSSPTSDEKGKVREADGNRTATDKVMDLVREAPDGLSRSRLNVLVPNGGQAAKLLLDQGYLLRVGSGPKTRLVPNTAKPYPGP